MSAVQDLEMAQKYLSEISGFLVIGKTSSPENLRDRIDTNIKVVDYLREKLEGADPDLIYEGHLQRIQRHIQVARGSAEQFSVAGRESHLNSAIAQLQNALEWIHGVPVQQPFASEKEARAKLSGFKAITTKALNQTESQAHALERGIDDTKVEIERRLSLVESQESETEKQTKQRLEEVSKRFDETQASWDSRFNAERDDRETRFANTLKEASSEFGLLIGEQREGGERLLSVGESAGEIVEKIADQGMAGGYLDEEANQRKLTDRWRWVAVVSLIATAVVAVMVFGVYGFTPGSTVGQLAAFYALRTAVPGPTAALSFYAIKEAGGHRAREKGSRRLVNQLVAIGPFLAQLPASDREEEVKDAVPRFFPGHHV